VEDYSGLAPCATDEENIMNKMTKTGLLSLVLVAAAVPAVFAQGTEPVQKPISIKLGVYLPVKADVGDLLGHTWFAAGADYAFSKTASATPILPLVYVDYTGSSKNGIKGDFVGVGLGFRAYMSRATNTTVAPYYGAGIGAYFSHASGSGLSVNNTQLGGKVDIGAELNSGPFLEAAYQIIPQDVSGSNLGGFNIMVGDRF
jgi:hypothetical protein